MITSLSQIINADMIPALKDLGKIDWLNKGERVSTDAGDGTVYRTRIPKSILTKHPLLNMALEELREEKNENIHSISMLMIEMMAKVVAEGAKIFRPTVEQFEALEHIDININIKDYRQPFEAFILEIPDVYCQKIYRDTGRVLPATIMMRHDEKQNRLVLGTGLYANKALLCYSITDNKPTIEDSIKSKASYDYASGDMGMFQILMRACVNFGLLMTHFGTTNKGPQDKKMHEKHLKLLNKKNPVERERAQRLLDNELQVITFAQDIVLYDRERDDTERDSDGQGGPVRPHWRRGHFRNQAHGPGNSLRKLIFVKPLMVNKKMFVGDTSDTLYQSRIHS